MIGYSKVNNLSIFIGIRKLASSLLPNKMKCNMVVLECL
jgi:hypothetical protein